MTSSLALLRPSDIVLAPAPDYRAAERTFEQLLIAPQLTSRLRRTPQLAERFLTTVDEAVERAFNGDAAAPDAHRFVQRVLYRINRLMLFWYDDLHAYANDRAPFVLDLRARLEHRWQQWELRPLDWASLQREDVGEGLRARFARDVDAAPSDAGRHFRDHATVADYLRLVRVGALDGLVEASQLSRTLGGVGNAIHGTLTRLLIEEYGGGRAEKKHSTHYRCMLQALSLDERPEAYFDLVPWEVLAGINHSFLLSDRKRLFLRYIGGLLYTEVSVPSAFRCYSAAAERLGLPIAARTYWDLHVKEDARHGPWMLEEVALPLVDHYPADAWELLLGYDQQRLMSGRAAAATLGGGRRTEQSFPRA